MSGYLSAAISDSSAVHSCAKLQTLSGTFRHSLLPLVDAICEPVDAMCESSATYVVSWSLETADQ